MKTLKLFSMAGVVCLALTFTSCNNKPKDTDSSTVGGIDDDSKPTIDSLSLKNAKIDSATARDTIVSPPLGVPGADKNNPDITK